MGSQAFSRSGRAKIPYSADCSKTVVPSDPELDRRAWSGIIYANSLLNSENNGQQIYNNWRVYGRLTQKFQAPPPEDEEESRAREESLISNAYYSIQVDYSKTTSISQDKTHKDNFFDYGYIGKFDIIPEKYHEWGQDTASNL
ncbi:MAG: hypothetical protein R6V85_06130, partial [Polyangia bacterium]